MFAYRDFKLSFFSLKTLDQLMPEVNEWIREHSVDVTNFETLYSFGGTYARSEVGIRVWYKN